MERKCELCGAAIAGRSDKRFCSDSCRSEFHNARKRKPDPVTSRINIILMRNFRLLDACFEKGMDNMKSRDLTKDGFDFNYFTSMERNVPWRREYGCFKYKYYKTFKGIVHISECVETK